MEKYDLIIVGDGPAGIFTAVELDYVDESAEVEQENK